jgi:mRNA interferase MazF
MVAPATGSIVLILFPFSDLTHSKLRPAVVLADASRGDWVLCQITSNPFNDSNALEIQNSDCRSGSLQVTSYARPGKLFTANQRLMVTQVGILHDDKLREISMRWSRYSSFTVLKPRSDDHVPQSPA